MPAASVLRSQLAALPLAAVAGCDEAGRGALAGPVMAAAVILPPACSFTPTRARRLLPRLNDSKALSPDQRTCLADQIRERALAWAVAEASREEIDRLNILQASLLAMRRALAALAHVPGAVVVDGLHLPQPPLLRDSAALPWPALAVVDGDALLPCIMAAGILAKVARDSRMRELDAQFPGYGFAGHKGYSAPEHVAALERLGPCSAHRRTFKPVARLLDGLFTS